MVLIRDGLFRYRKRSSNAISETFLRRLVLKTAGLVQPGGVENKYTTETQVRATGPSVSPGPSGAQGLGHVTAKPFLFGSLPAHGKPYCDFLLRGQSFCVGDKRLSTTI